MKQLLQELVDTTNPKAISTKIKNNEELHAYVRDQIGSTISEKIYNCIHPGENICIRGNLKKFGSITTGYKFCGSLGNCACAKESVSAKVSESKKFRTADQISLANSKRAETNLEKYGVSNVGQTATAVASRASVYADIESVSAISKKIKETKLKNHGVENYNNSSKIRNTYKAKREAGYWINKFPEKDIAVLEDKAELEKLYLTLTPQEISESLSVHIQTVYRYLNMHGLREPFKSADEKELVRFLESLGVTNIICNTRKLIPSKKEIDIYLPDYNIAIEYNGVYWHHEDVAHITRQYHYEKFKECEELGIQLITVFSNFWHSKKEIVKRTLAAKLGLLSDRVYARSCTVVTVDSAQAKEFLNQYHIQGYTPAKTAIGLQINNTLVALMTFSPSRIGMGKSSSDTELVRFASSISVVGGAGKLLKHYCKHYEYTKIVSFSDNEWSTGNLYSTLGFTLEKQIPPSYWYLKSKEHRLYHRFTFSKQKLVAQGHDPLLSESQITKGMGLLKVWDCGKKKWTLSKL